MKFALVFPGQGSQSLGMMAGYGDQPIIRQTFDEASAALGRDLWALANEGPAADLDLTVNTQPLMLTAGVAVYRLWRERGGRRPACVAGHSLGEYSALVAAEVLSLGDAVPLVELRARAMQEAVPQGQGAMAAILGLDAATIIGLCEAQAGEQIVEAVNFNAPEQTVIAGEVAAVQRVMEAAKAAGAKRAILLPVSAPFHCSLMKPAAQRLGERLSELSVSPPRIPLINNVDVASPDDPQAIREALVRQAAAPVRWVETLQAMAGQGITHILECGPGKVLSGLVKRCSRELTGLALSDLAGLESALSATEG